MAPRSPRAPEVYDFKNWDRFCRNALRYHNATRPGDNLMQAQVSTARSFMSPRVIDFLGPYVLPSAQQERFYQVDNWDKWVKLVAGELRHCDETIDRALEDRNLQELKEGKKVDHAELLNNLGTLASKGVISTADLRKAFSANFEQCEQNELTSQSLNPRFAGGGYSGAPEAGADQDSSIELRELDETIWRKTTTLAWLGLLITFANMLVIIPVWLFFEVKDRSTWLVMSVFLFGSGLEMAATSNYSTYWVIRAVKELVQLNKERQELRRRQEA